MTRQQRWASQAFDHVTRQKQERTEEHSRKYATACMKAPLLIKQSGLVQAIAFFRSRSDDGSQHFCNHLSELYFNGPSTSERLFNAARTEGDLTAYMAMTHDVIEIATWFRRFAQSELKADDAGGD